MQFDNSASLTLKGTLLISKYSMYQLKNRKPVVCTSLLPNLKEKWNQTAELPWHLFTLTIDCSSLIKFYNVVSLRSFTSPTLSATKCFSFLSLSPSIRHISRVHRLNPFPAKALHQYQCTK